LPSNRSESLADACSRRRHLLSPLHPSVRYLCALLMGTRCTNWWCSSSLHPSCGWSRSYQHAEW